MHRLAPTLPLVLALTACGGAAGQMMSEASMVDANAGPEPVQPTQEPAAARSAPVQLAEARPTSSPGSAVGSASETRPSGDAPPPEDPDVDLDAEGGPLVIYTAILEVEVDQQEIGAAADRVIRAARELGGYLAHLSDSSVQVRIPSRRFHTAMARLSEIGEVKHRSVSAQDVTDQFHDLEVRLANLRALRRRFEQLLSRASNIQEVMQVEAQLERLSREIDQIQGRLRLLRSQVAFSTITINLSARPVPIIPPPPPPTPPPPPPPPPQPMELPIEWLDRVGPDRLMAL